MLREYVTSTLWTPQQGYAWQDGFDDTNAIELCRGTGRDAERGLVVVSDEDEGRLLDPFNRNPALFHEMSQLSANEDAILAFANTYGDQLFANGARPSLLDWRDAIEDIAAGVNLWNAIENRTPSEVRNHLQWNGGLLRGVSPLLKYFSKPTPIETWRWELPAIRGRDDEEYATGEWLQPAIDLFDWTIQRRCGDLRLSANRDKGGKLAFRIVLRNLTSIVWSQLAFAAIEGAPSRPCVVCERFFSLLSSRDDRTTCSDSCRAKSYRLRKKRANELRSKGRNLCDIATELGSDLKNVKKWLQPKGDDDAKKKKKRPRRR